MIFFIPKGWHYALPIFTWLHWKKKVYTWKVKFTNSCRYDLGDADQDDTNKLCGIGYLPGHHVDSARFGWRYNKEKDGIDLLAYCYDNKQRTILPIETIPIGKEYTLQLKVGIAGYYFKVIDQSGYKVSGASIAYFHNKKLQYRLPIYFGGNRKAPRTMKIKLSKS